MHALKPVLKTYRDSSCLSKYHVYCKSKDKGPIAKNHAIEHALDVAFALKRQKKAE